MRPSPVLRLRSTWLRALPGGIAGLFLARVLLEAAGRPLPRGLIMAVGLLAGLGGVALGRWAAERGERLWPALLLSPYLFWPHRDGALAASLLLLSLLTGLLSRGRRGIPRWVEPLADGATFLVPLAVYVATAAPDLLPADGGEFQFVASVLGLAHPPGYPLYTLLGHLFIRILPWGTPAYRLNLMSGVAAAGAVTLVGGATRLWARRLGASRPIQIAGGLAAALILGTSTTFWAQATIANVRTLAVFFVALALYGLARYSVAAVRREEDRALLLLGLSLGAGVGHYPPLIFVSLAFLFYLLLIRPRLALQPRRWWRPAVVGLLGLLPFLYIPIRGAAGAPFAPPGRDTLTGFLHHVLAQGFSGDMFAFVNPVDLPHRLALLPTLFPLQFNHLILGGALIGLLGLLWWDRRLFLLLAGSLALHTFVSITYRAPQTVEYLMPAYLPIAVTVGLLPALLPSSIPKPIPPLLAALALWAGLLNGWAHGPSFVQLAQDRTARETVGPLLESAPPDALILADWRWFTPLRYLQEVEGRRPDVEVRYVYNIPGEAYRDTWQRRVQEATPGRPVLTTHFYQFDAYTTEPWERGFRLHPRPLEEPTAPLPPVEVTFGEEVQIVGYRVLQERFHPGEGVEFVLAWRAVGPLASAPSLTLRLTDGTGQVLAHVDRRVDVDVAPGEVRFERLILPLYPSLPPGEYQVRVGTYVATEAGFEDLPSAEGAVTPILQELDVTPTARSPFTLHPRSVPFAEGATWVGVDYDRSEPGTLRLYLHWRGPAAEGLTAAVDTAAGQAAAASLVPLPAGYQTLVMDLMDPIEEGLGLTLLDEEGKPVWAAGAWGWPLRTVRLPPPSPDARFVPLGKDMALVGVAAHPAPPGEVMALDLALVSLRPLTQDDRVSVRLMDMGGMWLALHDGQPAMGAVPTLKWIRGSRVTDRHLLPIPADFADRSVQAGMVAYEGFRLTPLPPMDERFEAVPLGVWTLPPSDDGRVP